MDNADAISLLLAPLCDQRLREHVQAVDLSAISRLRPSRLKEKAMQSIGCIELVDSKAFTERYCPLYLDSFHGAERERPEMIATRLADESAQRRVGSDPYRVVGIKDRDGSPIAGAHFSNLLLDDRCVPYLQYIYVRPQDRRKDLSEVLHTLVLAVATADAARLELSPTVPFTLCESAPRAPETSSRRHEQPAPVERTQIHAKSGSKALMLKRRSDGQILSPHVQPGLERTDPPLTLVWLLRANPAVDLTFDDNALGDGIIASYYRSLRDEGFPEENVALAERIVQSRQSQGCDFCLVPLSQIRRDMYVDIDESGG